MKLSIVMFCNLKMRFTTKIKNNQLSIREKESSEWQVQYKIQKNFSSPSASPHATCLTESTSSSEKSQNKVSAFSMNLKQWAARQERQRRLLKLLIAVNCKSKVPRKEKFMVQSQISIIAELLLSNQTYREVSL